uniref:Serpentine receptor class gamma n=1 Tax=Parastrongyloides trichosuri TaxID=131310 RepID=A0A0N4ZHU2_PARTI
MTRFSSFDIISIIYSIPSLLLMTYTLIIILDKLKNNNPGFKNEFFPFVAYRLANDIFYNVLAYFLLKFPLWGIWSLFYLEHNFMAKICFGLGAFLVSGFFIHSLVTSFIRFIAVCFPTKYRKVFNQKRVGYIILGMITYGILICSGSLFFESRYIYNNVSNAVVPTFVSKEASYYTFAYGIVIYNLTILLSLFFNTANWYLIYKKRNEWRSNKSINILYGLYSLFTFIITCFHELYFILRVISNYTEDPKYAAIASIILSYTGDVGTYGDFYFILFISKTLRNAIMLPIMKVFKCNVVEVTTVNLNVQPTAIKSKCTKI